MGRCHYVSCRRPARLLGHYHCSSYCSRRLLQVTVGMLLIANVVQFKASVNTAHQIDSTARTHASEKAQLRKGYKALDDALEKLNTTKKWLETAALPGCEAKASAAEEKVRAAEKELQMLRIIVAAEDLKAAGAAPSEQEENKINNETKENVIRQAGPEAVTNDRPATYLMDMIEHCAPCFSCRPGAWQDGGVPLLDDGRCGAFCSQSGFCGESDEYQNPGTDCSKCSKVPDTLSEQEGPKSWAIVLPFTGSANSHRTYINVLLLPLQHFNVQRLR